MRREDLTTQYRTLKMSQYLSVEVRLR